METKTNYEQQAQDFLGRTATKLKVKYIEHDLYFDGDTQSRDIYRVTLRRNGKSYTFRFGQSIVASERGEDPRAYDVLACLTKSDPGTFDNFCSDFGYDTDSRKAEKTYKAVVREWKGVERLFGDVLELLEQIQ